MELVERIQAYKFRVYLDKEQESIIYQWCRASHWLYNWGLNLKMEDRKKYLEFIEVGGDKKEYKSMSKFDLSKMLTELKKKEETSWLKDIESSALIHTLDDLDKAYANFYRKLKIGKGVKEAGVPKFKSKFKSKLTCTIGVNLQKLKKNPDWMRPVVVSERFSKIKIPKIEHPIKVRTHRDIEGTMKAVTFSKETDGWYISILTKRDVKKLDNSAKPAVGIDRGVNVHSFLSDGGYYELPENIKKLEAKVAKLQRKHRNKEKFSENWKKAQDKIRKVQSKIARIRRHYNHEVSKQITDDYGLIAIEDLNTKNMTKSAKGDAENHGKNVKQKSGLNKGILRQGWHQFETMLNYKADWNGSSIVKVKAAYTSQKCSSCGHTEAANRDKKKVERFKCVSCGFELNADYNAAINILTAAHLK